MGAMSRGIAGGATLATLTKRSRHGMLAAMPQSLAEAFAVAPGDGLSVENPTGGMTTFKAMADVSGGILTALEGIAAPGQGPPLHVHGGQDELIYALEGRLRVRLGDELRDAPAGSFFFIPRGTPHTWQNVGDVSARFFAALMPAATEFEQFFMRYADLPRHERATAAFARLADETQGMEVVGPPLAQSHPS
jgi:quercetin dioxygenase-like cupin family protein